MATDTREEIAAKIRAEAAYRRLPHRQLAEQAGLSEMQFSDRMNGKTDFRVSELLKIAEVLGVPVSRFLPADAITQSA